MIQVPLPCHWGAEFAQLGKIIHLQNRDHVSSCILGKVDKEILTGASGRYDPLEEKRQ